MDKLAAGPGRHRGQDRRARRPDDAKDELDTFVKEVHASADNMREVAKSVEGGKPEEMTAALGKLSESMSKVGTRADRAPERDQLGAAQASGATTSAGSRSSRRPL